MGAENFRGAVFAVFENKTFQIGLEGMDYPASDEAGAAKGKKESASFAEVFRAYFRQEKIGVVLAFILFYRLGEAMLLKLVTPFFLDSPVA